MKLPRLTYVYAYYDNPNMLLRQIQEWVKYSESVRHHLEIIITDDCSTNHPITNVIGPDLLASWKDDLQVRVFRVTKKVPWNWLTCRNIGAHYAGGTWILMTDMDHLIQVQHAERIQWMIRNKRLSKNFVYLFTRNDAPDDIPYKPHNDSFLMTKKMFWKIGGYDEELSSNYGTSGSFRRRAFDIAKGSMRLGIPLTRYPREVILDASTTAFPRKEGRDPGFTRRFLAKKSAAGRAKDIWTLTFPYEEVK